MKAIIVDDDPDMTEYLSQLLKGEGYEVTSLGDGQRLSELALQQEPDVILLDSTLPGKSGPTLLRELRSHQSLFEIPVVMVTGVDGSEHIIEGLDAGADDYVTKPFQPEVLTARLRAVNRRNQRHQAMSFTVGDLHLDVSRQKVTLSGEEVALTLTEFKILSELLRERGRILTRNKLRERALGSSYVADRTIDVHMASLRKKLKDLGDSIRTIRGVGYRFEVS